MQATPNAVPHGHSKQCTATMPKQAQTPPKQWMLTKIMSTQSMTVQTLPCKEFQYPLLKTNGQKRSPDAMIRFKRLPMVCQGMIWGILNMWRFMRGRSGYYTLGKIGWTFALGKLDVPMLRRQVVDWTPSHLWWGFVTLQLMASGAAEQRYLNQVRTTLNKFVESATGSNELM